MLESKTIAHNAAKIINAMTICHAPVNVNVNVGALLRGKLRENDVSCHIQVCFALLTHIRRQSINCIFIQRYVLERHIIKHILYERAKRARKLKPSIFSHSKVEAILMKLQENAAPKMCRPGRRAHATPLGEITKNK